MARIPLRSAVLAAVTLLGLSTLTIDPPVAHAASTATIDGARIHQPIDGFGFAEAFGRGAIMHGSEGLSAQRQREVLDLLLSPTTSALDCRSCGTRTRCSSWPRGDAGERDHRRAGR